MPQTYQEEIDSLTKRLETNSKTGLSHEQIENRLKEYGPNKIKEEKATSPITIFFRQFLSPLMYILFIAAIASLLIGHGNDAIVIGIAVAINVFIGFFQEWKAERAALSLKSYEVPHCQVLRNGEVISVETILLVPGDIVLLAAGSRIPADIRLFHAVDLAVEEAILTGESRAIEKNTRTITKEVSIGDRENMAFSGTYVISGKGEGVVVATGEKTELGKIAQLIMQTKEEQTPLQKQIQHFSWFLGWLMLGITAGVLLLGIIKGFDFKEILITSIALAVAAIPEGLLVAVTVVLAIGMQRMLKRKALVRHLIAAETLGSVTVICTDKTGTLTKGHMAVDRIATPKEDTFFSASKEISPDILELLQAAALNNDAHIEKETDKRVGNPTEVALLHAARLASIDTDALTKKIPRIDEIPFSSDLKYMATVHHLDGKQRLIVKGAPEKLFPMISFDQETREWFKQKSHELTQSGLRVLALAQKDSDTIDVHAEIHNLT
ncbi:HAD-IC family P-type ATPase, partial [Candidatus Babeliales bacterium]|nr:HAD-IC family P-type ATPase [Candidatus Babeliales bacterium]